MYKPNFNIISPLMILVFFILFSQNSFAGHAQIQLRGQTMGTFYQVTFLTDAPESKEKWAKKIDMLLKQINRKLSMYDPKSELSRFNQTPVGQPHKMSGDFVIIMETGLQLYRLTQGAWDGTVKPLVDLWGFGTRKKPTQIPAHKEVINTLDQIGFSHIQMNPGKLLIKQKPVFLDFGSIAKGYGVDAIARLFANAGIEDVLVNIGGELYGSGKNQNRQPWSIGISRPDKKFSGQTIYRRLKLTNQAIATSGNYRNFYTIDGQTFSHIIDPKTGYPVKNNTASASVISKDCTFADGLATALMVMDIKDGIDLVNRLEETECLIVQQTDKGYIDHFSENFDSFVLKE